MTHFNVFWALPVENKVDAFKNSFLDTFFTDCPQSIIQTNSCQVERSRDLIFKTSSPITSRLRSKWQCNII